MRAVLHHYSEKFDSQIKKIDLIKGAAYEFSHHDGRTTRWMFEGAKKDGLKWTNLLTGEINCSIPDWHSYRPID